MRPEIEEFRDGIFALRTRRFGTVAELMIEVLFDLSKSKNQFHDRTEANSGRRVEIKFSTVMKENDATISMKNVIEQCKKANLANRAMSSDEISRFRFDCNIQQVKRKEFDVLFYGVFFQDKIAIFKMESKDILNCKGYSDKQHKGNEGEGQFHLNQDTFSYHLENHFEQWLGYDDLYELFRKNL